MSSAMMADFSQTKGPTASDILSSGKTLWRGGVLSIGAYGQTARMTALPESPAEIAARLEMQRTGQRTMLEHVSSWLKLAGLKQKDVAEALGVSEATVSNWIAGRQQMSVGQLQQIAVLLRAKPGDILGPTTNQGLTAKVEEALQLMDALDDDEWQAVIQTARSIAKAKRPG